ncbi:MAG: tetratricopeptide repeat protein [Planctomycetes bacterium]|nr:tetratricopeptide repeat protein [Planctomycetota bacterium]
MRNIWLVVLLIASLSFAAETSKEDLLKQYQSEIAKNPMAIESHRNYQNLMREMGKMDEVKKEYQAKLDNEPNSPLNHYLYGRLLEGAALEKEFSTALELEQKSPDTLLRFWIYYGLAQFYKDGQKWDDAIKYLGDCLKLRPDYTEAQHYSALCVYQKGDIDKAIGQWDKVIAVNPDYADARLGKATALKAQGKFDQAIKELEVIIKKDEAYWNAYEPLIQCHHAKQDYKKAGEIIVEFKNGYSKARHVYKERKYIVIDLLKLDKKTLIIKQLLWTSLYMSDIPWPYYFEFYDENQVDKEPNVVYAVDIKMTDKTYRVEINKKGEPTSETFKDKSAPTYQKLLDLILAKEKGK